MEKVDEPTKYVGGDGDQDEVMTMEEPEEFKSGQIAKSKDKKLEALMKHRDSIMNKCETYIKGIKPVEAEADQDKIVEGRDIDVCIRARPLLEYELEENYFDVTHAENPNFYFMEPKTTMKMTAQANPE